MKQIYLMILVATLLYGRTPSYIMEIDGNIMESVLYNDILGVATNNSKALLIDVNTKKVIKEITIDSIDSFYEDNISAKIFTLDLYEEKVILVSEANNGTKNLILYDIPSGETIKILENSVLPIKVVRFVSKDLLLLGLISNELILYDIKSMSEVYKIHLDVSTFFALALSEDKKIVASTCESGDVYIVDTLIGKVIKKIEDMNKDSIFDIDLKQNIIATAGRDRKAGIYNLHKNIIKYIQNDFLIYTIALNKDATLIAFQTNERNDIALIEIDANKKEILRGHTSALNTIIFIDEHTMVSTDDGNQILFWDLGD